MPDLVTHTAIAYFIIRFLKQPYIRVLFYLGTILPDIISRPVYILVPSLYPYTVAIHTPVFVFTFALLSAEFFHPSLRRDVRLWLFNGILLHFGLDLFQKHVGNGYYHWFYPFSWDTFEIGLIWPEDFVLLTPVWIIIVIGTEFYLHKRN